MVKDYFCYIVRYLKPIVLSALNVSLTEEEFVEAAKQAYKEVIKDNESKSQWCKVSNNRAIE